MPVAFDLPEYRIAFVFISSTLYGIFLVLFSLSTLVLHQQCKKSAQIQPSSTAAYLTFNYLMFLDLTAVWIISAVICFNPGLVDVPNLQEKFNPIMFSQHIVGYIASFIGDIVMVYRLYIIWDQNKLIPYICAVLVLVGLGLTALVIMYYAHDRTNVYTPNIVLVGLSVGANMTATSLIAWRVWQRHKLTRAMGGRKFIIRLLAIVIESSALYTTWMLTYLITHFTSKSVSIIFLYGFPHIAGIASMLINVRVGLGWAAGEEGRSTRSLNSSAFARSQLRYDSDDDDV